MGIAGLLAGQRWIAAKGGVKALYEEEMTHATRLYEALKAMDNVTLYCADMAQNHLPVFVFNIDGLPADQAGQLLDVEHNVITRTGLHCAPLVHEGIGTADIDGTVRFSVGAFTTAEEIDQTIAAVEDIAAYAKSRSERTTVAVG
jgi:selenocysteine lyase/cysteine desulfurase